MKRIGMRSWVLLLFAAMLFIGAGIYVGRFFKSGNDWVAFPVNKHLYSNASLKRGEIKDIKGLTLLKNEENGKKSYSKSRDTRTATLHIIGDKKGNIATSAQSKFAYLMSGYNKLNGTYSLGSGGGTVTLTVDAAVCTEAYKALGGKKGTVAVCNYKTGDLLCCVSSPSFDPENPPKDINDEKYEGVYLNRFISSSFVPGSIYKLVTTAALLENGFDWENFSYKCTGTAVYDGVTVTCSKKHGKLDLGGALTVSCNCAFAELSQELGEIDMILYANKTHLNNTITVDDMTTASGTLNPMGGKGVLAWSGIGQAKDTVNPAAMLAFVSSIANGGEAKYPNLIDNVRSSIGVKLPGGYHRSGGSYMSRETAEILGEMMRNNVLDNYGEKRFKGMELCAKSGTAEVDGKKAHSWFVGFSQRKDFPVAFVCLAENGGSGSKTSGDIASAVLKKCAESMGVDLEK